MSEERYEPVSCDYHDELEAAAVQRSRVELEFDLEGRSQHGSGKIADVYTANGAEWVRFVSDDGGPLEIRLDHIISFRQEWTVDRYSLLVTRYSEDERLRSDQRVTSNE